MYSNSDIVEVIKLTPKQFTHIIEYNNNSNSSFDNNIKFVHDNLPYNRLSIQLLANDSIIRTKKKRIVKTKDESVEAPKIKVIQKNKTLVK